MAKVAVVGSINMDLVVRVPRFPLAGETILGGGFQTIPGGKGANQAVAARRLGAEVAMIGRVGGDAFGECSGTISHKRASVLIGLMDRPTRRPRGSLLSRWKTAVRT